MTNRLQAIYDMAALCAARHVRQAILCPGSRNAPLILAFSRHPDIQSRSVSDERSAAFIALGIAQQTERPVVIAGTSGSAAYNFAPAIAEAFFAHTPLLILTADRPTEWVGQQDGQTIYQQGIFGQHVKGFFQLPQEYEHPDNVWSINRMMNDAISLAGQHPMGPVHINVPLREPLYPGDAPTRYSTDVRVTEEIGIEPEVDAAMAAQLADEWPMSGKVLVIAGQQPADAMLREDVKAAKQRMPFALVADALSNLHGLPDAIRNADLFLGAASTPILNSLKPDLLITFGESVISKPLKKFLRTHRAGAHWHIQPAGAVADTFKTVTKVIRIGPREFFRHVAKMNARSGQHGQTIRDYDNCWQEQASHIDALIGDFYPQSALGEAEVVMHVLRHLPPSCNVHLANSMSVRYATQAGLLPSQEHVRVYSNRGTSGIDGCNSTAVGHALSGSAPNILITGDVAFFYDRNAFWHNYPLPNLRIVLLNNSGGGIFKMIDGPGDLPEVDEFLVTRQPLTGRKLCEEFSFEYNVLSSRRQLANALADLMLPSDRPRLLEFGSSIAINRNILQSLKQKINDSYEH